MFVTWRVINGKHHATEICVRGVERRWNQRREKEVRRSTEVDLQAYVRPLVDVSEFKYLGRVLVALYNDCPVVVGYFSKARNRWERV